MSEPGGSSSPYGEELLREAQEALDRELRAMDPKRKNRPITIRRIVSLEEVMEGVRARPGTIRWALLAAWLRANPNVMFRLDSVPSSAFGKFKARHPDITVIGVGHHREEETGMRVAQMFAIFTPGKERRRKR